MSRVLSGGWLLLWLLLVEQAGRSLAAAPVFDPATRMRTVLVPSDTAIGTVIYRLRASDDEFDYPLHFELLGKFITNSIKIIHKIVYTWQVKQKVTA